MAQTAAGHRRKWKKWLAIYLAAAAVVYLIVFLVFFKHGGGGGGYGNDDENLIPSIFRAEVRRAIGAPGG